MSVSVTQRMSRNFPSILKTNNYARTQSAEVSKQSMEIWDQCAKKPLFGLEIFVISILGKRSTYPELNAVKVEKREKNGALLGSISDPCLYPGHWSVSCRGSLSSWSRDTWPPDSLAWFDLETQHAYKWLAANCNHSRVPHFLRTSCRWAARIWRPVWRERSSCSAL